MDNPIAAITPSSARRLASVSIPMLLGGLVLYLSFTAPPASLVLQAFLIIVGIGSIILGDKVRRATLISIIMTDEALIDSSGRELCRLDEITGIDRGAFAFKPANGFLLRTETRLGRVWLPGLWWRFGRRIGVGGATPSGQGKFMAELVALHLKNRGLD